MTPINRRTFVRRTSTATAALAVSQFDVAQALANGDAPNLVTLTPVTRVDNPLQSYPSRDWEKIYRDLFTPDSDFVFLCAPNDTHNCLLRAYVKNGVIVRIGPTYGYGKATDIYGNKLTARWDPRLCQKGLALVRRIHGNRRPKGAYVRLGFKRWAEAGFPRDADGRPPTEYMQRGRDSYLQVPWDEAFALSARVLKDVAKTYSGEEGARRLRAQGYDADTIEQLHGAGTQTIKIRGGMAFLGALRLIGMYRLANGLALLDAHVSGVDADHALGARGWDSYSWHTDLPPGHPLVTGQQTLDWDLVNVEQADLVTLWGMNWITTKMPDAHFLTEARLKGTKVVVIACEYQATANKADEVLILRPGTDTALALGLAEVILHENLYDEDFVQAFTDLPLLVREDTHARLKASDLVANYAPAPLAQARVLASGETAPAPGIQDKPLLPAALRQEWGDYVVWDTSRGAARIVTMDDTGSRFLHSDLKPALSGRHEVTLADGTRVAVRPLFDVLREHLAQSYDPASVSKITWLAPEDITRLARDIASHKGKTLFACGMGPNHFFNADLKDRAVLLVAALTANIGKPGGNVGSYAGNYRGAFFNGLPAWATEDPFHPNLDAAAKPGDVKKRKYFKYESAHYWNYGDRPFRVGSKRFTGASHMPTPSKALLLSNSNSIIGNAKWHYDVVMNTLPRMDFVSVADWWWTASCEYADIVFGVDSWAETKSPDFTASVTNPFLQVFPVTPMARLHDTKADLDVVSGIAEALAQETQDERFLDYFRFSLDGRPEVYLQRIIDGSSTLKGYRFDDLHEKAKQGIPALLMTRTSPKTMGYEQIHESKPWYTKTGRLEFYRDETTFLDHGENLPVHREPVDATIHEPNVIVAKEHAYLQPKRPEDWGFPTSDQSSETRQVRNVRVDAATLPSTQHPLRSQGFTHVYITPKYRHGAHTTPVDLDMMAVWFGPFGDMYRFDRRSPWVGEGYVDLNPLDAKDLGIDDGDYVWLDGDPGDRPYRGWKPGTEEYKVARCLLRARYYPGIPRTVARTFHNMYVATFGSVRGHEENADGLARNPATGYQAMFRYGAHQSATRAWLRPTLQGDDIARKNYFGQEIGQGYEVDIYTVNGAPKESFAKFTRAEAGRPDGTLWRPAALGLRPGYESEARRKYLRGEFIRIGGA